MAKIYTTVGALKEGQFGSYIELGQNGKNEKYNYTVEVRVTKPDGTKQTFKNPKVALFDPRKRPGIKDEELAKIPEWKLNDLVISSEE
jgi:hypothetical protein